MKLHSNDRFGHKNVLYFKIRAIDCLNQLQASHSEKSVGMLILRKIKILFLFCLHCNIQLRFTLLL